MIYGMPYKGSKNKLAERIVRLLPEKTHLIDLFCGGCAVSHAALVMGKYDHVHINDLNWMCPSLFIDALNGKYQEEDRWISRENFQRLKDIDPYVAAVWSFGNNMRTYLYSREIEPLKKAIHYALFFHDYSPGIELGHDLSFVEHIEDTQKRYIAVKRYFRQGGNRNGEMQSYDNKNRLSLSGILHVESYEKTKRLQELERGQRIICAWGESSITSSVLDYEEVEIPQDSVIYCDIPYEGTDGYQKGVEFDYERFYAWAEKQTEPVFISSYKMPSDRFDCIKEFVHRCSYSQTANNRVKECIFVPKHQAERGNIYKQLNLFD